MIDLKKINVKYSLRWYGERYNTLSPIELPIAGKSISDLQKATSLKLENIHGVKNNNAFILSKNRNEKYLYVKRNYKNYRKIAEKVFGILNTLTDVDHVLGKTIAKKYSYEYILIALLPFRINRKHGSVERKRANEITFNKSVCYMDNRIYDKILLRFHENSRTRSKNKDKTIDISEKVEYGLTLKQKGIWNKTFGFYLIESNKNLCKILF